MNLYEKKSKKEKVEFTQTGPDVTYTNPGEANSKERKAAIKDMLAKHSGGGAVKKYVKQKQKLNEDLIVDYLISEEFASSEKSAEAIMRHMSEEWLEHILSESEKGEKYAAALKKLRTSIESGEAQAQARLNPTGKDYVPTKRATQLSKVAIR